jgi:hypothetical protein
VTLVELASFVTRPGFMALDRRVVNCIATLWQESWGNPQAVGKPTQVTVAGVPTWGVALGLCQLFTVWHVDRGPFPDVPRMTVTDCFDPDTSWIRMWLLMNRNRAGYGYDLSWWSAFTSGAYKAHVPAALVAVRSIGGDV